MQVSPILSAKPKRAALRTVTTSGEASCTISNSSITNQDQSLKCKLLHAGHLQEAHRS